MYAAIFSEDRFVVVLFVIKFIGGVLFQSTFQCLAYYEGWIADIPVMMLFLGPVLCDAH